MIWNVPYYSQRVNVTDADWQWRACGVACVAMVLAHRGTAISLDALIEEGRAIGAYRDTIGWVHDGLVKLAAQHGVALMRKEFKGEGENGAQLLDVGVNEIVAAVEEGRTVLVSAAKGFDDATKPHLVLVVGFEIEEGVVKGLYYHDPDAYTEKEGKGQFVTLDRFKRFWRKLAVFEAL
ncbi:MAG: hypothetical protein A2408_01940 [Candidatus Yonathbacteria bacterium RIFOXYC1_FULL_52_10]|uniref:Peptidase C39-like domain-containing protein n=1 Tax=Candidatus Yonathbacteria bacterium RIFOXYD1_FULL_52_36 TaxID=1802730 RepID=A0A1G2SJR1_9BACT|nr:MAG: hypothetical protein A2408_01940 [Candidatus Yonathbacteria bacterium RIFOXYC1_FULL_52_10]OHA85313.1 MAG: hypothetical protein A2591_04065 [Candidatus Yonathbacteria bacterium RIFOXYD1_FULL_52_36]